MCKKLMVVGVVVVAVGAFFVFRTQEGSLVRVWYNKLAKKVEKKITPEDRVAQIKLEIKKIDQAIKDEADEQARMEREYGADDLLVKSLRIKQEVFESKMTKLETAIEERAFPGCAFGALVGGEMVLQGASTAELKAAAVKNGMSTLRTSGIEKVLQGVTTTEEVGRVTMGD